ncbi:helix-turn-helix domain-containing protein [Lutimaribacter marinistellae]|uniref:Helix-turn-helix domain-containing protein n=1 Tax=Lutimaribacter marinistellae TaxID=1820329 RepID=A0ABV7TGZ5_9RHOB
MNEVDVTVGQRIKARRMALGMSQAELGDAVGVRFQQVQKYESGANRVSASRLWSIAEVLGVHVSHFFEGIRPADADCGSDKRQPVDNMEFLKDHDTLELVSVYSRLTPAHRHAVLSFVKSLTDLDEDRKVASG